jgi:hypothetical protein
MAESKYFWQKSDALLDALVPCLIMVGIGAGIGWLWGNTTLGGLFGACTLVSYVGTQIAHNQAVIAENLD